jgi:hypothetical protein
MRFFPGSAILTGSKSEKILFNGNLQNISLEGRQ